MPDDFLTEIKRVVADPTAGPTLNDLLNAEAGRLIKGLADVEFDPMAPPSDEGVISRLDGYVALTADLARAMALGARWSGDSVRPIWPSLIERVVAATDRATGQTIWADLSLYPGVLLLYTSGVGALAGGRYDNLRVLFLEPRLRYRNEWLLAVEVLNPIRVLDPQQATRVAGLPKTFAPISERLAADVRPLVADLVPDDPAFGRLFDRFEYLLGLIYVDAKNSPWGPSGRFAADQYGTGIDQQIEAEITEAGATWAPLAAGLFGGSLKRRDEALDRWRNHVQQVRNQAQFFRIR
jgi:hypothetical protein